MGLLKSLFTPPVSVNGGGREAWDDRKGTYDRTNATLASWATANGAELIEAPEFRGERFFGTVRGERDGVAFEMRGWMDMSQTGGGAGLSRSTQMAFFIEVRATPPGPVAIRKLVRRNDHGPYTEERLAKLYKGDLDALSPAARAELVETATRAKVCELEEGRLLVSSRDPELCPPEVDEAGLDWLVGRAVSTARALTG